MSRKSTLLIFVMTMLLGSQSLAQAYRRLVNFEWDAIEGATSYDVELTPEQPETFEQPALPKPELKKFSFKSDKPSWNGKITPGKYMMRLRSRDYRGVPGDWSPQSGFDVGLDAVSVKSPVHDSKIAANNNLEYNVNFVWSPVGGAKEYNFELASEDGSFTKSEVITGTNVELKIPVAMNYNWKISAVNKDNIQSVAIATNQFTVIGRSVQDPTIIKPESRFVREVTWSKPDFTNTYDAYLFKLDPQTRKWEKFQTYENMTTENLPFELAWPGGKYQLAVRAKGKLRESSKLTKQTFEVVNGDRSPASEYTTLVRTSIDRVTGWFGIASYLITQAKYDGIDQAGSNVTYEAVGGTGRLGAGWLSPNSAWGFLGIADLGGFTINGKNQTFATLELNSVYRNYVGDRSELRLQAGLVYKEVPQSLALGDGSNQTTETKVSSLGPHLGVEFWYSLTPKLGVQVNTHLYFGSLKMDTPNGQALIPTISNQVGFLGSYRFNQKFTGLVGYARREDKASYKDGGETIATTIVGHYLNFLAEWSF